MPDVNTAMEVERVMNLVRGFGWEKTKEEWSKGELSITISKTLLEPEGAVKEGGKGESPIPAVPYEKG